MWVFAKGKTNYKNPQTKPQFVLQQLHSGYRRVPLVPADALLRAAPRRLNFAHPSRRTARLAERLQTDCCPLSLGGQQAQAHLSTAAFRVDLALHLPAQGCRLGSLGSLLHPSAGSSPSISLPPRLPIQPSSICSPLAPQLSTPP